MRVSFRWFAAALALSLVAGTFSLAQAQALPAGMSRVTSVKGWG